MFGHGGSLMKNPVSAYNFRWSPTLFTSLEEILPAPENRAQPWLAE